MTKLRRPCTIDEMGAVLANFRTDEALQRGLAIAVRPTDVFISTYPKSGTTWLQHVAHGLRSNGSLEFDEISDVVPWLETAHDMGIDPDADQHYEPRMFKAHLEWQRVPKGGRYITAFRHPKAVLTSFYHFFEDWFFEAGTIEIDEFARRFFLTGTASGSYWDHIVSWSEVIGNANVLALSYEDMVTAPDSVPAVVADFLGLNLPRDQLDKVIVQSSRGFMAKHAVKFDEHNLRALRDPVWGLPPGGASTKVRAGPAKVRISEALEGELDGAWAKRVTPALGFADYEAFRQLLPNPLGAARES